MLSIAGGFVLGEVLILLRILEVTQIAAGLILPAVWLLYWWRPTAVHDRDTCKRSRSARQWLLLFCLPLLVGAVRAGDAQQESAECLAVVRANPYPVVSGMIGEITDKGNNVAIELRAVRLTVGVRGDGRSPDAKIGSLMTAEALIESGSKSRLRRTDRLPGILLLVKKEIMPGRLKLGMTVTVTGELEEFQPARNPGEFDAPGYYRGKGLHGRMSADKLTISDARYDRLKEGLRHLRQQAGMQLGLLVDGPEAGIFQAAVLGDKGDLDPEIRNLYSRNGISHLLALSGLHLSLIASACYQMMRKGGAGFWLAGLTGGAVAFAYVLMTGSSVSVVRAAVMLSFGFLAAVCGRKYDLLSAMAIAVVWLLYGSPYLLFQSGFQLSFGAIAGIGFVQPYLCGRESSNPAQALGVSLAVQSATLPFTLYHFYQTSMYGIVLNLIVIPLMAFVIISGLAGIMLGGLYAAAGMLSAWMGALPVMAGTFVSTIGRFAVGAGYWVLVFYEWLCVTAGRLPYSLWLTGRPSWWQLVVYFVLLVMLVICWHGQDKRYRQMQQTNEQSKLSHPLKTLASRRLCLLFLLQIILLIRLPVPGLRVTFLDVGQGDGICLQSGYTAILVDGGSSDIRSLGKYRLEPFLKHQGIAELDYVFVSHGDSDHISGIRYLLTESADIRINNLMLPAAGQGMEAYTELGQLAQSRGGQVHWFGAGDRIQAGELQITCLYPGKQARIADTNSHSLVLKADYGDFHLLLTGDMGAAEEAVLLSDAALNQTLSSTQVLKLAHHGSRFSTSPEWLDVLSPGWAVVSYGEGNSYGHPHTEVLERINDEEITLYQTAGGGAITLSTDGKTIQWQEWLKP